MAWLERGSTWIDRHERWALGALIGLYAAIVSSQGALKLLWVDELITFYIAKQEGVRGIWRALEAGADPNPPLMHLLVKASTRVFGDGAESVRLPAMLGVLLAIVAMWWMLRRWVRPVFAAAGVLAFMATRGFDYAYDARSYALLMGFAMASLALWMRSAELAGRRRFASLAGMAVALAAGISSNYYGVLAFFPIAAGELVARRFRVGVWLAMAAGALPLLAYLPLIRHNIAEFGPHAWNRPQVSMVGWSYLELVEGIFWPVLGLGIWVSWRAFRRKGTAGSPRLQPWVSVPQAFEKEAGFSPEGTAIQSTAEMAALGILLIYPFIGFGIAVAGAGMISPRCVVPVCCGFGLAAGVLAQKVFGRSARAGMAVVLLTVVWVGLREEICANLLLEQRQAFFALRNSVAETQVGQILVADSSFALPLYRYSEREVNRLTWFPIDFEAIHRYEKDDSGEQNIWAGRHGVFWFRIRQLSDVPFFTQGPDPSPAESNCPRDLTVIARPEGWLAAAMKQRGFTLTVIGDTSDWERVGGEFTPMAHFDTRMMRAHAPCPSK